MTWKKTYSVGVQALDDQHATLLGFLNTLHAASMRGQAQSVAGPLLSQLTQFSREHLSTEEGLMETSGFPGLIQHRELHRELTGKLPEYTARHGKGDATVYVPLLRSLYDCFNIHTLTHDMEFGKWLTGSRIRQESVAFVRVMPALVEGPSLHRHGEIT
jgi:hemerythrin-like metal-binding protein